MKEVCPGMALRYAQSHSRIMRFTFEFPFPKLDLFEYILYFVSAMPPEILQHVIQQPTPPEITTAEQCAKLLVGPLIQYGETVCAFLRSEIEIAKLSSDPQKLSGSQLLPLLPVEIVVSKVDGGILTVNGGELEEALLLQSVRGIEHRLATLVAEMQEVLMQLTMLKLEHREGGSPRS
jgi:hypothetical protein